MAPSIRRKGETPPVYSAGDDLFSVEVHHGGFFVGYGENRAYIDEKVDWFDHCDIDSWSTLWFHDFSEEPGYKQGTCPKVYWLLPDKTLADGLRIMESDADTLAMSSIVNKIKNFVLYLDHENSYARINWDDIVVNTITSLPKVLSPHKVHVVDRKVDEKLPEFYSNLRVQAIASSEERASAKPNSGTKESSDEDSDFCDSDYELEQANDELFVDNVDEDVVDEGIVKGKKVSKGKKALGQRDYNEGADFSSDDEGLQLTDFEGEGAAGLKFKTWMPEDINNPVFKVGMVFGSVQEIRKAITEYSLKNRVSIKLVRNEKKRVNAACEEDCPWKLNSSWDKRPIICLDGCHIKTKFGGQLLTAIGIDPNDCIYPIAMGVVEVESLTTWKWFLETLKQDLGIENTYPWTMMIDKQKGLIPVVEHVFPESEHRFCVRHLYSNFQQQFKGENLKNQLWACARSSSIVEWNKNMEIMKTLNAKAYDWLEKMPPNTWKMGSNRNSLQPWHGLFENDRSSWEKVDAAEVLPPIYVKKVGRPPKSRRKQAFEKEGGNGVRPKLQP
ncbi:hypothetical protein QOZ80_3BG0269560 [Eleusine coracana subsp. coracana]|nr:hypothetical protein QOZ80_3BG0269560 [Eleusine coracana subsp. coracana]